MMKIFKRFFHHIKEGFVGVRRHLGMSLSSASAVTITLLLVGIFMLLSANLSNLSHEIENSISLVCLVDYDFDDQKELNRLEESIKKIDGVLSVDYRSKEEEFDYYNKAYPEMAEFSDLYRESNPFHDAFLVNVHEGSILSDVKNKISSLSGISSVEDGGDNTYILIDILQSIRWFGGILVLSLCVLAIYLIFNTIKITIDSRQDEITIMRNVGALNGYIRFPFVVEGIIIALMGVIIPIIVMVISYQYLYDISSGIILGIISLIPPFPFLLYTCLILMAIGIVVGIIGSYISVSKNLRLKR